MPVLVSAFVPEGEAMTTKPVSVHITKDGKVKPIKKYKDASQKIRERKSKKQKVVRRTP